MTFDFGNTLVPVDRASLAAVSHDVADAAARIGLGDRETFLEAWADERERQFREEVPNLREIDLEPRATRIAARLRGLRPPAPDAPWDDAAAAAAAGPEATATIVEAYSRAFLARMPPSPSAGPVLADLHARGFRLAILSNWPHAATIDRYAAAQGWSPFCHAIVVSQRVGVIKPHPRIFETAAAALETEPPGLLHVGDDWAADVIGAVEAGWRAAYLRDHQRDTPLPTSERRHGHRPDLELDRLADLPDWLADPPARAVQPSP